MLSNIFRKSLFERRWVLIAWAAGLFTMTLLTMSFYPFFKDSGFDEVIANAPKALESLLGQAANYKTVTGYVDQQIFALRMPLMTIIMAVSIFVGISAGDEGRGTLETLLAQPVSRTKVFIHKFAAAAVFSGLACLAIIAGVMASYPIINGSMNFFDLLAATFGCWLVSVVFGALGFAIGTATGKRGPAIGITSAVAFGAYLISSMAPAVEGLKHWQKLSPFYYYNTPSIAQNGLNGWNVLILVSIIAVLILLGLTAFVRRDLVRD